MKNKLFYSPDEASDILGICTTYIYREIKLGNLDASKYGRRTLISAQSIDAWASALQEKNYHE